MDKSFLISNDAEEILREQKKQQALHYLLPGLMGGNRDETEYVLLDYNDKKIEDSTRPKSLRIKKAKEAKIENETFDTGMDPWKYEKMLDRMQTITSPGLFGKMDTTKLPRPQYRSKEEYDSISRHKFESVMPYSFAHEGGYSNHKHDRGGETNWGITKGFMLDYAYALPGGVPKDIKDLTKDDAKALYKAQWDKYNLGRIRSKRLAYTLNDYMINSYARECVKRLQGILNQSGANLNVDGFMGEKTLEAIHNADVDWLIEEILIDRYKNYLEQIQKPNQEGFKNGWLNRLRQVAEKVGFDIQY